MVENSDTMLGSRKMLVQQGGAQTTIQQCRMMTLSFFFFLFFHLQQKRETSAGGRKCLIPDVMPTNFGRSHSTNRHSGWKILSFIHSLQFFHSGVIIVEYRLEAYP